MDQVIKEKWIAALRSGNYAQTTGVLNRIVPEESFDIPAGFCCLGVLIDVVDPGAWASSADNKCKTFGGLTSTLDHDFIAEVGLSEDKVQRAINMNDQDGASFNEIADMIEQDF